MTTIIVIILGLWAGVGFLLSIKLVNDEIVTMSSSEKSKRRFILIGGPILWIIHFFKGGYRIIVTFLGGNNK